MGRNTTTKKPTDIIPELPTQTPAEIVAEESFLKKVESNHTADRDHANQLHGQLQLIRGMRKFFAAAEIKVFIEIRDSKKFNHITIQDNSGTFRAAESFSEYCTYALDEAPSAVYEMIQNYQALGDAYDDFKRIGLDRKHFRALRQLPEPELETIIEGEAIRLGDKEEIVELIENLVSKHSQQKTAFEKQNADLKADLDASQKLIAKKDEKINELDKALHKLDNAPLDERIGDLSQRLERKTLHTIGELLALDVVVRETLALPDAPTHLRNACNQAVNRVQTALDDLRAKYALSDIAHEPEDDAWMEEARKTAAATTGTSLDELDWEEA